jgi:intein/homing endonuclease
LDKNLKRADFSSCEHPDYIRYGKPDIGAPGVNIGASTTGLIGAMNWYEGPKVAFISGTCLTKDVNIYTPDGPVELKDLKIGDMVYSFSFDERTTVGKVVDIVDRGIKEIYEVVTADGRRLFATENHPILVRLKRGNKYEYCWKRVDELGYRTPLVLAKLNPIPVEELDNIISIEIARALGYFLADGWLNHGNGNWQICTSNDGEWFFKVFGIPCKPYEYGDTRWLYAYSKRLALALMLLGFDQPHKEAKLPRWLYHISQEKMRAFIDGFAKGDAHIDKNGAYRIELASEQLVRGLKYLCDWAGYKAWDIKYRERLLKPPNSKDTRMWKMWRIYINTKYYAETSIVKRVEKIGEDRVYDLTVEPYPHFVAEGIVVHNSMATPHISGLMALWAEYAQKKGYNLTRNMVMDIFKSYSKWNSETGYGVPKFNWIVDYLK